MGNATSCAPSILSLSSAAAKVLLPNGRLQLHVRPVNVGELMVENSGYFVCESGSLKVGHRVAGLSADEALEPRHFYFILPMDLLYSVLTHDEMSALSYRASKAIRHGGFNSLGKIFPICIFPSNDSNKRLEFGDALSEREGSDPTERAYSKQRSWKPALETIVES
ncbi:uncharacterized protein LOC116214916 [Punica granatum]|uniref:Uncharacterized protein n=2 Tax=Punica granatum TaxID=22663 RepID=A0A218VQ63_PUNGR|nr:uncharacterized protein LOC116214916 [Punica granatum]OWM62645.1 hypothetical protein CDL15_Pgr019939 [Punica granatum]PKI44175.1 hypothetical protein CRG98_035412 [Punica granatum]